MTPTGMPLGRLRVEVALGGDPTDPATWDALWTQVQVREDEPVVIRTGARSEGESSESTSIEVKADNRDGRWVPENPLGPWFGLIGEDTPLRVVWDDGTDHERFVAFITDLPLTWDRSGVEATATVRAEGLLRRLQQSTPPLRSAIRRRVIRAAAGLAPLAFARDLWAYWPLEGDSLSSPLEDVPAFQADDAEPGRSEDTPGGSEPVLKLTPGSRWAAGVPSGGITPRNQNRVTWLYNMPEPPGSANFVRTPMRLRTTLERAHKWEIRTSDTEWQIRRFDTDEVLIASATGDLPPGFYGAWHTMDFTFRESSGNLSYRLRIFDENGETEVSQGFSTTDPITDPGLITSLGPVTPVQDRFMGHVVVETNEFGLLNTYSPVVDGFTGEPGASRITRLGNEEDDLDVTIIGTAADSMPMGPQRPRQIIDLFREVEDADGGLLSDFGNQLVYRTLDDLLNQNTALILESVRDGRPVRDDRRLTNDVTVKRPGGDAARVTAPNGVRRETEVEVNVATDADAQQVAEWLLHLGTQPQLRWPRISIQLHADNSILPQWLALRLGDRIGWNQALIGLLGVDVDLLVMGWAERITTTTWDVEINAVPAAPFTVGEFDHAVRGRFDTDGSELADPAGADDTSLSVAVTAGPLWTTDPAEAPFDIDIAGEQLTVTAITDSSSPQTFTVTRAVNAVHKPHDAGAAVRLHTPARFALGRA